MVEGGQQGPVAPHINEEVRGEINTHLQSNTTIAKVTPFQKLEKNPFPSTQLPVRLLPMENWVNLEDLTQVHPAIKRLFTGWQTPTVPLAGRLKYFLPAWRRLT